MSLTFRAELMFLAASPVALHCDSTRIPRNRGAGGAGGKGDGHDDYSGMGIHGAMHGGYMGWLCHFGM